MHLWHPVEGYHPELLPWHNLRFKIWGIPLSSWFKIITGVREGDLWSPLPFGLAILTFHESSYWRRWHKRDNLVPRRSSRYPEVKLTDLDDADDIALFEETVVEMAKTSEAIRAIAGKLDHNHVHRASQGIQTHRPTWKRRSHQGSGSRKHCFLQCPWDNVKELNIRIGKASAAFRELDKEWRDRNINLDTLMKFYNACVLSTFLYECECWALTEWGEARFDAFDMRCQRKILRVVWSQYITNSSIRSKTKQPQVTVVIRKLHLQWFGHIQGMDMDHIPKKLYLWKPAHEKRWPGRREIIWWAIIQKDISKMDLSWTVLEAEVAARKRIMWRYLSNQAVSAVMHDANK